MAAADGLRGITMDDYISRKDAAEWFMSFIMMDEDNIPADVVVGDLKTAIPAADVEPVRMGQWNGALKIGGSRLRATNALRAGLSITERGFAAFITAPTAAQKWKVVQTDDAMQR